MPDCGKEHGQMCQKMIDHEKEIDGIWAVLKTRLSSKIFFWVIGGVFGVLLGTAGWFNYNAIKIADVKEAVAVMKNDTDHVKKAVDRIESAVIKHLDTAPDMPLTGKR